MREVRLSSPLSKSVKVKTEDRYSTLYMYVCDLAGLEVVLKEWLYLFDFDLLSGESDHTHAHNMNSKKEREAGELRRMNADRSDGDDQLLNAASVAQTNVTPPMFWQAQLNTMHVFTIRRQNE